MVLMGRSKAEQYLGFIPFFSYIDFILSFIPLALGDIWSQVVLYVYIVYSILITILNKFVEYITSNLFLSIFSKNTQTRYVTKNSSPNNYSNYIQDKLHLTRIFNPPIVEACGTKECLRGCFSALCPCLKKKRRKDILIEYYAGKSYKNLLYDGDKSGESDLFHGPGLDREILLNHISPASSPLIQGGSPDKRLFCLEQCVEGNLQNRNISNIINEPIVSFKNENIKNFSIRRGHKSVWSSGSDDNSVILKNPTTGRAHSVGLVNSPLYNKDFTEINPILRNNSVGSP